MTLTFGSLFAGIGGFDLGFERAGMRCVWQVEIDSFCRQVLKKHWPNVRQHDDVRTWPIEDTEPVDIICGGFPCQDVSLAGKRSGISGERSGLWKEFARIIAAMRPRFVVIENVPGLCSDGLNVVVSNLSKIGYDSEWQIVSACAFGAPHTRSRLFIVAYSDCERLEGRQRELESQAGRNQEREQFFTLGNSPVRSAWNDLPTPIFCRSTDGIPHRVDRLKSLGNAVVPQVAEWIGRQICDIVFGDKRE